MISYILCTIYSCTCIDILVFYIRIFSQFIPIFCRDLSSVKASEENSATATAKSSTSKSGSSSAGVAAKKDKIKVSVSF